MESNQDYYIRKERQEIKRRLILSKAANRGEASVEWHKHNTLTAATLIEFQKAMKQADKDWESANANKQL